MGKGKAYVHFHGTLYRIKRSNARRMLRAIADHSILSNATPEDFGGTAIASGGDFMVPAVNAIDPAEVETLLSTGLFAKKKEKSAK